MPHVRILSESLANKIAAGEVVERPASVVKELVENALDAGSGEIIVEIEAGGKKLIRVTDNGCGMSREDALLSLERHATSKIFKEEDIASISTLGFRGEALPAIASVSRFTLATKEKSQIEGTEIVAEGGKIREVKACGMADGTVVAVRSLFFNTPARLKFLKTTATEAGHVGELMTRFLFSRPDLRFTYIQDGATLYRTSGGTLKELLSIVFGEETASALYPLQFEQGGLRVEGYISRPECSRSAPSHIYTYINGRFIRDKVVQHAILEAYRHLLERGRYPVLVLHISLPPDEVDVNVHPTKHEVRFRRQGEVHDGIRQAVEQNLKESPWLKKEQREKPAAVARVDQVRESLERYSASLENRAGESTLPMTVKPVFRSSAAVAERMPSPLPGPVPEKFPKPAEESYFSSLAIIGQFSDSYIICQSDRDLVIIDQHAAHERVAFEMLKRQYAEGEVESQTLLFPETLECSFSEAAALRENFTFFQRLGFHLEDFGGTTIAIKAVPRVLADRDYRRTLREIMEELAGVGKSRKFEHAVEELLSTLACHSVVRGRRSLTPVEIKALLASMDATAFSSSCPHGRPVYKAMTLSDVEKMFKR